MNKLFSICFLFLCFASGAQTNVLFFRVGDILSGSGSPNLLSQKVVLTDTSDNPRLINGVYISPQPKTVYTHSDGKAYFTNVVWGTYNFGIVSSPEVGFDFQVQTNTTGLVDGATLTGVTNQPNPVSSFYTIAQINALFATVPTNYDAAGAATNAASVARTYYVGPIGNDSWSGATAQPYATLFHSMLVTSNIWVAATNTRQAVHVMAGDHTNDMNLAIRLRYQDYVDLIGDGGNYLELTNFNGSAVGGTKLRLGSHGRILNLNIKDHDASAGTESVIGYYGADGTSDNGRDYIDNVADGGIWDSDSQFVHIEGNTTSNSIAFVFRNLTIISDYNPIQIKNQVNATNLDITFFNCKIIQTNRNGRVFGKPFCCIAGSNIGSGVGHTVKFVGCTFVYGDANTATNAYFFFDGGIGSSVDGFSFSDCFIGPLSATNNATTADFNSLNAAGVVRDGGIRHIDGTPLTVWNGTAVVPVFVSGTYLTNLQGSNLVGSIPFTTLPSAALTNLGTGPWTNNIGIYGNGVGLTNVNPSVGGTPTLGTNLGTSTLVASEAIQGSDHAFLLGFLLSAATQQAVSNYFPITLSKATSTNIVTATMSMQSWGMWTNSVSGNTAPNVRFVAVCTSNTVTIQSAAGAVPTASSMESLSIHIDQP